jgi:integrase
MLLTFAYFTGARPGEILEVKREDCSVDTSRLIFRVPTLKLSKRRPEPIRKVRFVEYPNFEQFPELKSLWSYIQPLPNGFYVFGWLKTFHNPRAYFIRHLGLPAYFFRHNLFSLFMAAGGRDEQLASLKGGGTTEPYKHLSKEKMQERGRVLNKAIK